MTLLPIAPWRGYRVIPSATDKMTIPRLLRSFSSNAHSNAQKFLTGILYFMLISASLTGGQRLTQAESARPSKESHVSNTLPLTSFYDAPHPLPMGKPGELIRSEPGNQYSIPYELSALRILYHSRTSHGEDVAVSGVVLIPDGKPPAGGWPVLAWAHEFRSLARQCAPTLMRNLGVGPLLAMYANLGYVVVATDYAGLGSDSGKPVEDMESNALDVIYSVAAAREAVKEIGAKWIAVGAFQGALASIGVAENEMRDPGYRGSIATSGLADAHSRYQRLGEDSSSARMMLVLASTLKTLYPEFQLSDMLTDAALPAYKRTEESCGAAVDLGFNTEMIKPGWENGHYVKDFFIRNSPGQKMANGSLLVISGELDKVVSPDMTTKTVDRMCKKGDRVLFLKYPNLEASGVMGASAADQISWIKARFAGDTAPSNCH